MILSIVIFTLLQLINVVLGTLKTVTTTKGSILIASIVNAVAFGFNTLIIKQIADQDLWITVPIVVLVNLIGVYICLKFLDKVRKAKVWEIKILVDKQQLDLAVNYFKDKNIKTITVADLVFENYLLTIISSSREDSSLIYKYLAKHNLKEVYRT